MEGINLNSVSHLVPRRKESEEGRETQSGSTMTNISIWREYVSRLLSPKQQTNNHLCFTAEKVALEAALSGVFLKWFLCICHISLEWQTGGVRHGVEKNVCPPVATVTAHKHWLKVISKGKYCTLVAATVISWPTEFHHKTLYHRMHNNQYWSSLRTIFKYHFGVKSGETLIMGSVYVCLSVLWTWRRLPVGPAPVFELQGRQL